MRGINGLVALVLLVASSAVAQAQTPVPVPLPSTGWFLAWDHDKVNLHHFELKVDAGTFATVTTTEPTPGVYRTPVPAMTPGTHTIVVRACTAAACSTETSVVVSLTLVIHPVTGIRALPPEGD